MVAERQNNKCTNIQRGLIVRFFFALSNVTLLFFIAFVVPFYLQSKSLRLFSKAIEHHNYYHSTERPPIYSYFVSDPIHFSNISFDRGWFGPNVPKSGYFRYVLKITREYSNNGAFYLRLCFVIAGLLSVSIPCFRPQKCFIFLILIWSPINSTVAIVSYCLASIAFLKTYLLIKWNGNLRDWHMETNFQQFFFFMLIILGTQITIIVCTIIPAMTKIFENHFLWSLKIRMYSDEMLPSHRNAFYFFFILQSLFFGNLFFKYAMMHRDGIFFNNTIQEAAIFSQWWLIISFILVRLFDISLFLVSDSSKKQNLKKRFLENKIPPKYKFDEKLKETDEENERKLMDSQSSQTTRTTSSCCQTSLIERLPLHHKMFHVSSCDESLNSMSGSASCEKQLLCSKAIKSRNFGDRIAVILKYRRIIFFMCIAVFLALTFSLKRINEPKKRFELDSCFTNVHLQKKRYSKSFLSKLTLLYYFFSTYPFSIEQEKYRRWVSLLSTATGKSFDVCHENFVNKETIVGVKFPDKHPLHGVRDYFSLLPRRFLNYFTGTESCSEESPNNIARDSVIEKDDLAYQTSAPVVGPLYHGRGHEETCVASDPELDRIKEAQNLLDLNNFMSLAPRYDIDVKEADIVLVPPERRRRFPREGRRYSDYDRHTHELLVAATCPGGGTNNTPVVIIEDLFRQEFGHDFELLNGQDDRRAISASPYYAHKTPNTLSVSIEEKYGKGQCDEVLVDKHGTTISSNIDNPPKNCVLYRMVYKDLFGKARNFKGSTNIIRVEQRVRELHSIIPAYHAPAEAITKPIYPRPTFQRENGDVHYISPIPSLPFDHYRIPLLSETVSVLCPQLHDPNLQDRRMREGRTDLDYLSLLENIKSIEEEYHVHPLPTTLQERADTVYNNENCTGVHNDIDHIPNILCMITDSASRQSFLRNLPRVASWLRYHEDKNDIPVVDMKGSSTVGPNTYANLAGAVSGIPFYSKLRGKPRQTIWGLAKNKYGREMLLALGIDMCDYATNGLVESDSIHEEYKNVLSTLPRNDTLYPYRLPPVFGGGNSYMDKETDGAYCHHHSSGRASPRKGYSSIWKRCIGGAVSTNIKPHSFIWGKFLQSVFKLSPLRYLLPSTGSTFEVRWVGGGRHNHDYNMEYLEDSMVIELAVIRKQFKPELFNKSSKNLHVRLLKEDSLSGRVLNSYKRFMQIGYFFESHEQTHSVLNQMDLPYYRFLRSLELVYHYFQSNDSQNSNNRNILMLISDHGPHDSLYKTLFPLIERNMPYIVLVGNITREHRDSLYPSTVLLNDKPPSKYCQDQLMYQRLHRYTSRSSTNDSYSEKEALNVASVSMTTYMDLYHTFCDWLNIECGLTDDIFSQEKIRNRDASIFNNLKNATELDYYITLYNATNKNANKLTLSESVKGRFSSYLDPVWIHSRLSAHIRVSCADVNATGYCYKEYCN